jgi:single-stranded DNA-binding protein
VLAVLKTRNRLGATFTTWIPVKVFGKGAEDASTLAPGTPVYVEGKISRCKGKDGGYDVIVSTYSVHPFTLPSAPVQKAEAF